jgi:hypothetical protein
MICNGSKIEYEIRIWMVEEKRYFGYLKVLSQYLLNRIEESKEESQHA